MFLDVVSFENFSTIAENMKSLFFLDLSFTAIKELPSSIGHLSGCSRFEMVSRKSEPTIQPVCSPSKRMETTSWSSEVSNLLVPKEILCLHKLMFLWNLEGIASFFTKFQTFPKIYKIWVPVAANHCGYNIKKTGSSLSIQFDPLFVNSFYAYEFLCYRILRWVRFQESFY